MSRLSGPASRRRAGRPPRQLVVLLHGVGADGNDLIGLAPALAPSAAACRLRRAGRARALRHGAVRLPVVLAARPPARRRCCAGVQAAAPLLDASSMPSSRGTASTRASSRWWASPRAPCWRCTWRRGAPRRWRRCSASRARCSAPTPCRPRRVSRPPVFLIHGDADEVVPVGRAVRRGRRACRRPASRCAGQIRPGLPHAIDPEGIAHGGAFLAAAFGERLLPQEGDGLAPAERRIDPLAIPLAKGIVTMRGGAPADRRVPAAAVLERRESAP